jgi:hypothetical protein
MSIRSIARSFLGCFFGQAPAVPAPLAPISVPLATPVAAPVENAATTRDRENLATITTLLSDESYGFRSLRAVMKAIATTDAVYARTLLREVGAREAYRNDTLFGLKSRVGQSGRRNRSRSSY